jgi:imidazolonepropionase-like amidohydrolase
MISNLFSSAIVVGVASLSVFTAGLNAESFAVTGATIHTAAGQPIVNGTVLVRDGRIVEVGSDVSVGDVETIDLSGMHLFPGLIDAASVLGLDEISAVRATIDSREVGTYTPEVAAWVSVNPDSELIPVARANGIAYAHLIPGSGVVAGQSAVIQTTGWTIEDMATKRSAGLVVNWPDMSLNTNPNEKKSFKDQDKERQEKLREMNQFFDQAAAYARARKSGNGALQIVPAWEAMIPFIDGGQPVFVLASELRQIKVIIQWKNERKLNVVLVGGRDAWKVAGELAAAGIPVVFDSTYAIFDQPERSYDEQYSAAGVLHDAGVRVALAVTGWSDDPTQERNLPYMAGQAMGYGLDRDSALKMITLNAAYILGMDDSLGSIEKGKAATFIAVDGDILDIRSNVKRMWIGGEEVSLESRHTRLNEKYKNRPRE